MTDMTAETMPVLPFSLQHLHDNTQEAIHAYARAYAAALAGDGERLDWIESTEAQLFRTDSSEEWAVILASGQGMYAPTLRDAIDAALQADTARAEGSK